jgi:hypothetical protein
MQDTQVSVFDRSPVLNLCIVVSEYKEQYSLCQPLLPLFGYPLFEATGDSPPIVAKVLKGSRSCHYGSHLWSSG